MDNLNIEPKTDRSFRILLAFVALFALAMGVESCSTIPKAEIAATANPSDEVSSLNASVQEGYANHYEVLAKDDFSEAVKLNKEAQESLSEGKAREKTIDKVAYGRAYIERAKNKSNSRRGAVEGVLKARDAALAANIRHTDLEKKLEKIDDRFSSYSDNFQKDLSSKESAKLEKDYYDLELLAIQNHELTPTRNLVSNAEKQDAENFAPMTYKKAQNELVSAQNSIAADRHNSSEYHVSVAQAHKTAKTLYDITVKIKASNPKLSEEAALQLAKQDEEINKLQGNLGSEKNANEDLSQSLTQKEKVLSEKEQDLAKKDVALVELRSKEQRQEAIVAAQNEFTQDEAEVYQQGDKVIIRLKKINFPSGSAKVPAQSESLLSKVLQTINRLDAGEVKVEGHSDATGSPKANKVLSQKRADEIAQYLKNAPASTSNIEAIGLGNEKPIANNKTASGRAQNRRVDLIITPKSSM